MLKFTVYFYYAINDPHKEPIDKVVAFSEESALDYFVQRKKMDRESFIHMYKIDQE